MSIEISNSATIKNNSHHTSIATGDTQIRFLSLLKPYTKKIFIAFSFLFLSVACTLSAPLIIKIFIDDYITHNYYPLIDCALIGATIFLYDLASSIFRYLQGIRFQTLSLELVYSIRKNIFQHLLRLPMKIFDQRPTGSLISRVTNDTENITLLVTNVFPACIEGAVMALGIFIALTFLNIKLAFIAVFSIPLLALGVYLFQKFSKPYVEQAQSLVSQINTQLSEYIQGMFIIRAYQQTDRLKNMFKEKNIEYENVRSKTVLYNAIFLRSFGRLIMILCIIISLFYFYRDHEKGLLEPGLIFVFVNYLERLFEPLMNISMQLNQWQQSMVSAGRIFSYMDEPTDDYLNQSMPYAIKPFNTEHKDSAYMACNKSIEFRQVSLSYDQKTFALRDVTFDLYNHEFIGIVGHTGSGKSSIVNLLMGLYPPSSGEIFIHGHPITSYTEYQLRSLIGLILQEPYIFRDTVRSNITLKNPDISDEQLKYIIDAIHLTQTIERLPGQLDYQFGERGNELSTGEKQLLAFARTLLLSPPILILDEATASIDSELESTIKMALDTLKKGRTTIVIAHRLATIFDADRIIVMDQGRILDIGNHATLLSRCPTYQALYKAHYAEFLHSS
jgi:ATP-binding cassette subfamily B multidrug efflux pump